jgi:hypothetical protein
MDKKAVLIALPEAGAAGVSALIFLLVCSLFVVCCPNPVLQMLFTIALGASREPLGSSTHQSMVKNKGDKL